jgi:type II secretory pathway component PulF
LGQYSYKAVTQTGSHVAGTIEAADRRSAVSALTDNDQFVIELTEQILSADTPQSTKTKLNLTEIMKFASNRIHSKDILAFTNQLSAALRAGLPLLNGLEIIRDQQHKTGMRKLMAELAAAVRSGQSLSEAMAEHGNTFNSLYLSMVRVGETGGILEQTMAQLVTILDRDEKIKTNMKNASVYPMIILIVGLISVIIVIRFVMPNIIATIGGSGPMLPWPTKMLLALSDFIKYYGWFLFIAITAGGIFFRQWARNKGRLKWDSFKLKIPVLGSVLRSIAVGRFARTLGALTKGGVTILESLSVVRDTLGNELLGREIDNVAEKVKGGASLAGPLEVSGYFPPLLVQIVSVGEQTGELDALLLNAAETFDEEADSAIAKFIAVFPAVLILLLALVIAFIVAATLLPMVQMSLGSGLL